MVNVASATQILEIVGTNKGGTSDPPLTDPTGDQGLQENVNIRDYNSDFDKESAPTKSHARFKKTS